MKCGIIGCGRNTEDMHIPAIKRINDLKIDAVFDIDSKRVNEFAQKHRIKNIFEEIDDFFDFCSNIDFIIISTPGFTHFDICKQALARKLNILVEKPVTLELDDAIVLKEMANNNNSILGVIQNYRYRKPVIEAKIAQKKGVIGKVTQFNSVFHGQALFNEPTPWSWDERKNKTLLYEMMIHLLDLQIYFAGPVKRILGYRTKVDEILKTTTNIYAMVEHENQAIGIVDFQLFSSSNYIGFEIFGTANDVKIKLQPHYLRIYSGTINPLDEFYLAGKRIWDFGIEVLKDKIFRSKHNRKASSHYEIINLYVNSLKHNKPFPVDINEIIPTMEYAQMLSDVVY